MIDEWYAYAMDLFYQSDSISDSPVKAKRALELQAVPVSPTLPSTATGANQLDDRLTMTPTISEATLDDPASVAPSSGSDRSGQEDPCMDEMVPFLYAYFSQPHSLLACELRSQKIELSCYDIVLKGAKNGYSVRG